MTLPRKYLPYLKCWFERNEHGRFAIRLTHLFFFTNASYPSKKKYWVRIGKWRRAFGPVRWKDPLEDQSLCRLAYRPPFPQDYRFCYQPVNHEGDHVFEPRRRNPERRLGRGR